MKTKYNEGDIIKTNSGNFATVLKSNWVTICEGWHPDKRRSVEEVRVLTEGGEIKMIFGGDIDKVVVK